MTPNSTDQMRGLSKGSWPIVSTAFDNVLGWSGREGAEIVAVAQVAQGITLPIYVRPEIKSWEELRGKPLAVDAVDTAYALVLRRMLLAHGLEMERGDYRLIPKGATGHRLDSMIRGETFAGVLNPPWDAKAAAAGMVRFADPGLEKPFLDFLSRRAAGNRLDLVVPVGAPALLRRRDWAQLQGAELDSRVKEMALAGNAIEAVELLRLRRGLGLTEAKALVEGAPMAIKEGVSKAEAEDIKKKIEEAGGTVEVK